MNKLEIVMADMQEIAKLMRELEDQLVVCMRCGLCQAACPVFEQTGREADVARGKLALLDGLMQEMFRDPRGVYERLNRCLLCGSCAANCPSGVDVLEIFMKARAILTGYTGLSATKKLLLRGMLVHPKTFDRLAEWGARFQQVFTRPVNDLLGTSCARYVSPLLSERHFVPLAKTPFHSKTPAMNTDAGESGVKAAFFVGCLIDKIFPRVAEAAIQVLNHHGVGVYMPEAQGCCGIPAASSGDADTFKRLVQYNLEIFEDREFDYLVTACATCTSTIKEVWPVLLGREPQSVAAAVKRISAKTLDIHQFLVSSVGLKKLSQKETENPLSVTYHDPCHLKKSLGVAAEPRAVLEASPGYHLKEMHQPDACCGMGGSFNLQYYAISSEIGKQKRDNIKASGAEVVATGCPACMLQISDVLSRSKDRLAVKHPIEIYAEAIKR
ncbi:MAG: (Fe-S)-binding protein [Desulfobacterales bacterium]|nr:(Fe-S)-binding protein [Desulfobacterales bacterium]